MCLPHVPIQSLVFFINLNPVLKRIFLTTMGVIVVNFHLSALFTQAGISCRYSWVAKVMYGGTKGNKLAAIGASSTKHP